MKKIISILLTVIMVFSLIAVIIPASAAETGSTNTALKFKSGLENVWRTDKKIDSLPRTFEATIAVPASYYDNYEGQILALYSIYHEGHFIFVDLLRKDAGNNNARGNLGVRLLIKNGVTEATKVYYEALNAHVGQKVHIAITVDTEVRLYINGELIGEKAWAPYIWQIPKHFIQKDVEIKISLTTSIAPLFGTYDVLKSVSDNISSGKHHQIGLSDVYILSSD